MWVRHPLWSVRHALEASVHARARRLANENKRLKIANMFVVWQVERYLVPFHRALACEHVKVPRL
jgi:hypothetical protein